ncbi:bifunctional phosphopantothenoylcysteine decarboxylase/phosphopantothenate--cysteine ligase CoaBC [Microbacterium halophytorum]|uniref:bifunctional phosphopantothenoylcysteine decarboxylase/phosphopantothenate--cysteine ligase CoaBC n=1 Tax=Microbacterium halophytorum TaxID=2067568 RepID=UPI000CFBDCCF|nr:bifunctional phosphopantothenoylcysteine decarboxylase/phosphopantothenate--cysteine ligase CoaBC [Microbacterium halophytorum]
MFVVVGVSGGIAAYKTVHLVRRLIADGHEVHVVPTDDALRFVGLTTWEAISRSPVTTSVHDDVATVRHVSLGQRADLVIVAPATANTLAKMAAGLAGDLLGTTLLATTAPVVVAPAMHTEMWRHPATAANVATLRERGVAVVGPDDGPLTGGDSGPGRMSEPDAIADAAYAAAAGEPTGDLAGLRVVVTAGGTREPIDPVRYLGNRSSGRQGAALAAAAADRGADVTLIACNIDASVLAEMPRGVSVARAGTALELRDATRAAASGADVVVMAAAVADYRPAEVAEGKVTKEEAGDRLTLVLVENPDIVAGLAADRAEGQMIVAFAAETASGDDLLARARRKRERKGVDLLVVNRVGWERGFDVPDNRVTVIDRTGEPVAEAEGPKRTVADAIWRAVRDARA